MLKKKIWPFSILVPVNQQAVKMLMDCLTMRIGSYNNGSFLPRGWQEKWKIIVQMGQVPRDSLWKRGMGSQIHLNICIPDSGIGMWKSRLYVSPEQELVPGKRLAKKKISACLVFTDHDMFITDENKSSTGCKATSGTWLGASDPATQYGQCF